MGTSPSTSTVQYAVHDTIGGFLPGMVTVFTARFGPEGADIVIHPANAPCMLAVAAAVAATVAGGGVPAAPAPLTEFPTSGSVKKDQPPPTLACPFRCFFVSAAVMQLVRWGGECKEVYVLCNGTS